MAGVARLYEDPDRTRGYLIRQVSRSGRTGRPLSNWLSTSSLYNGWDTNLRHCLVFPSRKAAQEVMNRQGLTGRTGVAIQTLQEARATHARQEEHYAARKAASEV